MNREEAIRKLEFSKKAYQTLIDEKVDSGKLVGKDVRGEWKADTPLDEAYKSMIDALEIAIKALEHPEQNVIAVVPCGDAISRQAVLDCFAATKLKKFDFILHAREEIKKLPSVTPQPKMGKWIKSRDSYGNNHFTCPFCENDIATKYDGAWEDNYCSNCGAKMQEVEE